MRQEEVKQRIIAVLMRFPNGLPLSAIGYEVRPDREFLGAQGAALSVARVVRQLRKDGAIEIVGEKSNLYKLVLR
ncbi:hypothetical protein [Parachitinimonas caeni]|uniref:Uncharacterized protein n=1 Tax=Parachitinimonas caeni TaxID=3031301 RepID=A0ABT7E2C5_9NEIS|nr:hypothetical protein [Parachitinimonas caeni]MDK2126465.1 hypothetical protein [Parachitinimonas caeni]